MEAQLNIAKYKWGKLIICDLCDYNNKKRSTLKKHMKIYLQDCQDNYHEECSSEDGIVHHEVKVYSPEKARTK